VGDNVFVGFVTYSGQNKYNYCLFDQNGDIIKCFPNYIFFNMIGRGGSSINNSAYDPVRIDNDLYLKDFLNDTIYVLRNSKLQPAYVFDLGKYTFPIEFLETSSILRGDAYPPNTICYLKPFVGTSKFFFYTVRIPEELPKPKSEPVWNSFVNEYRPTDITVYGIYNIAEKTNVLLDTDQHLQKGIINDINGGMPFIPRYYAGNGEVVDFWYAWDMKEILTDEYFATQTIRDQQAHERLRELLKQLKWEDNPVVVIAKLK